MKEETLTQLQHSFADMPHVLILDTIAAVCEKIVNRATGKDNNSSNTNASSNYNATTGRRFFILEEVMHEKMVSFYCLVHILEEVGLLSPPDADCAFAPESHSDHST